MIRETFAYQYMALRKGMLRTRLPIGPENFELDLRRNFFPVLEKWILDHQAEFVVDDEEFFEGVRKTLKLSIASTPRGFLQGEREDLQEAVLVLNQRLELSRKEAGRLDEALGRANLVLEEAAEFRAYIHRLHNKPLMRFILRWFYRR